jgi:hypothetical protein
MYSLPILGILVAGIGGFIVVASWDTRTGARRKAINILAYVLIAAGVSLSIVGIFQ